VHLKKVKANKPFYLWGSRSFWKNSFSGLPFFGALKKFPSNQKSTYDQIDRFQEGKNSLLESTYRILDAKI
jgi:hypothetical protein